MSIHKAIIPVAGYGTRMLPAAKAVPKELLPILDRPVIQYVVEEAASAGISDVLLVTSRDKRAVEDHFDRNAELEERLAASGRSELLESIHSLGRKVKIHATRQPSQRGLGDAVNQARWHVGKEPFLCMLGDNIFTGGEPPAQQLLAAFTKLNASIIGLEEVPAERVDRYGIVAGNPLENGVIMLNTLVEKPALEAAPSRLAIAGRYILTPAIFDCLDKTVPGKAGEVQLTDAIRLLLEQEPVYGVVLNAKRHDIGNVTDWLKTNLLMAAKDSAVWAGIAPMIKSLLAEHPGAEAR